MNLSAEQVIQIAAIMAGGQKCEAPVATHSKRGVQIGQKVIVRSRDAGVQFGTLDAYEGSTVHLSNARQMWSWTAAEGGTLFDCATHGVKGGKFSAVAPTVTVIGACAIIKVEAKAVSSLEGAKWA